MRTKHWTVAVIALCLLVASATSVSRAQESWVTRWQHDPNEPDWWLIPENWTAGVPTERSLAIIDNGGTAIIHWTDVGWVATAKSLILGGQRHGTVSHRGGDLKVTESLWVGQYGYGTGRYHLMDGRLSAQDVYVDSGWYFGPLLPVVPWPGGYVHQSGGASDVTGTLRVGYEPPIDWAQGHATDGGQAPEDSLANDEFAPEIYRPQALYVLSGGELATGRTEVGIGGAGRFVQRAGLHAVEGALSVGGRRYWPIPMTDGGYAYEGNATTAGPDAERPWPYPLPRDASYAMQGGELRAGWIDIDAGPRPWPWAYPMEYGALAAPDPSVCPPPTAPGSFVQTGGDVVVQGGVSINGGFDPYFSPADANTCPPEWSNVRPWYFGEGSYRLEKGSLTSRTIHLGQRGRGRFVQEGGVNQVEATLQVGGNWYWWEANSTATEGTAEADMASILPPHYYPIPHGTYVLKDGELSTGRTEVGVGGVGRFVQSGGTHKVAGAVRIGGGPHWSLPTTEPVEPGTAMPEIWPPYPGPSKGSYEMIDGRLHAARIDVGAGYTPWPYPWDYEPTDATLTDVARPVAPWSWGVFRQTGGEVTADGCVSVHGGLYEIDDGSLTSECVLVGGRYWYDRSRIIQNGGTVEAGSVQVGANAYINRPTVDADISAAATDFAPYPGAETYTLAGGRLRAGRVELGGAGRSMLVQTGGVLTADRLAVHAGHGTYSICRGAVRAGVMQIGSMVNAHDANTATNWLRICGREAQITVTDRLVFAGDAGIAAVPGSRIRMFGADHENYSTDPVAFRGMDNLRMIFSIGPEDDLDWETYEVAGKDLGFVRKGFVDNFVLETLQVGGELDVGELRLIDEFDNQPDWDGAEALYVRHLIVTPGSRLDLNGLNLYYLRGDIADPGSVFNGALEWLSSPEWLLPGDYNLDGLVTDADYTVWADNYGTTGATIDMGDYNGDGLVTDADYTVWADNYGASEGAVGVPEPTTAGLLVLLAAGGAMRRRRP